MGKIVSEKKGVKNWNLYWNLIGFLSAESAYFREF
jgi:hypothetical protein